MNQDILVTIEHFRGEVAEISYVMLAAGRALARGTGGDLVALLLGYDARGLAGELSADRVLYTDHPALADFTPDAYLEVLAGQIRESDPRAVLFGHTSIGMDLASGLSARLDMPLVTQCRDLAVVEDGGPRFVSQMCGGKLMAEGPLPEPTALLTVVPGGFMAEDGRSAQAPQLLPQPAPEFEALRFKFIKYIEPESDDIDITQEPLLIAVGRGLQNRDDMELVEELAEALGAAVCASRPIVDLGWLPTSRLVGKSGRTVKPKLYLALGISGAPEHVEAITDSDLIMAVNTDPAAPIFDLAEYGAEVDMFDLVEAMTEQLQLSPAG